MQDGMQIAWSEDSRQQILKATDTLNGQNLISLDVDSKLGRSSFGFDLGGVLETWPYGSDHSEEQWMIYTDMEVFSYNAGGQYALHSSDTPDHEVRWLALC